ncbi:MAG: type II secretion system minor pseudopilin GspK [Gammaproteobacteria bacterium]|nr:type II secretion system minor pseudopilin GspK [Gammaproteobacteria bacterium]
MKGAPIKKQKGVTLLIVLVIVALSTVIATQLIEHGTFAERRTTLMLSRDQAYQLALGGESLARQWLAKGFAGSELVHLNQPWATTPFEYPIEGGMINGEVMDAQSCFNLNSLDPAASEGDGQNPPGNEPPPPGTGGSTNNENPLDNQRQDKDEKIFENLINEVLKEVDAGGVTAQSLVAPVVDWIDNDIEPKGIDGAEDLLYTGYEVPYRTANSLMASKSELRMIKGFNAEVYEAIKDYLCVLPRSDVNKINVNTLLPEQAILIAAMSNDIDLSLAQTIISNRPEDGYDSQSFAAQLPANNQISLDRIDFTSKYFLLKFKVDFKGAMFRMGSLVESTGGDPAKPQFRVIARYFGEF